jgi:hypothetical protein
VYRVSREAVRSFSKLLETLALVRVTYAHVWARVTGWVGKEEKHTYCCYAYRLYFLTCDMYKSSLRHIHNPVLSSLKMKGIRFFVGYLKTFSAAQSIGLYRGTVGPLTIVQDVERSVPGFVQSTILAFAKG